MFVFKISRIRAPLKKRISCTTLQCVIASNKNDACATLESCMRGYRDIMLTRTRIRTCPCRNAMTTLLESFEVISYASLAQSYIDLGFVLGP